MELVKDDEFLDADEPGVEAVLGGLLDFDEFSGTGNDGMREFCMKSSHSFCLSFFRTLKSRERKYFNTLPACFPYQAWY